MTSTFKNISTGPVDLSSGQVLDIGETSRKLEVTDHERRLIDQGALLLLDSKGRDQSASVKSPDTEE